jgi:hypothetical protein
MTPFVLAFPCDDRITIREGVPSNPVAVFTFTAGWYFH